MKFEYKSVHLERSDLDEINTELCRFGSEGWETIDVLWNLAPSGKSFGEGVAGTFIFKRQVEPPPLAVEVKESQLTRESALRLVRELLETLHPKPKDTGRAFFYPECERCWSWDNTTGCAKNVVKGGSTCEPRCGRWSFLPACFASEMDDDPENAEAQADESRMIRPLFVDGVAVCTGSNCEQFDIIVYKCKLAGAVVYGSACPVWYKRKGKYAPPGIVQFIHDRESFCPEPENNWEPLVKEIEKAMEDFAHPCWKDKFSCDETTEKRRAAVEIVLCAVENAGYRVIEKGGS